MTVEEINLSGLYFMCASDLMMVVAKSMKGNWWAGQASGELEEDKENVRPEAVFSYEYILKNVKEVVDKIEEV